MVIQGSSHLPVDLYPQPDNQAKTLCTLSYLSMGLLGLVVLLLGHGKSRFERYHFYQSLILGLIFLLVGQGSRIMIDLLASIFSFLPAFRNIILQVYYQLSYVLGLFGLGIIIYSVITIWQNKYTWIKWISAQVHRML